MMFFIQPNNNIFTRHFIYDLSLIDQPIAIVPGKLFDNFHTHRQNISGYLFQASYITQEIIDFIQQFKNNTKIYLYFDQFNLQLYNDASSMIRCIIRENIIHNKSISIKQKNTIKTSPMYSEQLIHTTNLPEIKSTTEDIIADISDIEKLPENLEAVLYPNTKLPIKLFNNQNINHVQNLGFMNDFQMLSMINQCKLYIDTNTNYLLYSLILHKPTLALETNSIIKKTKTITEETIKNMEQSKLEQQDILKNSYKNFIQKHIL